MGSRFRSWARPRGLRTLATVEKAAASSHAMWRLSSRWCLSSRPVAGDPDQASTLAAANTRSIPQRGWSVRSVAVKPMIGTAASDPGLCSQFSQSALLRQRRIGYGYAWVREAWADGSHSTRRGLTSSSQSTNLLRPNIEIGVCSSFIRAVLCR